LVSSGPDKLAAAHAEQAITSGRRGTFKRRIEGGMAVAGQGEALRVGADLDERRARAALTQALFREVNDRIHELGEQFAGETAQYVCECPEVNCTELIRGLTRDEYRQIRLDPAEFVVAPGHERLDVEEVVDRNRRWLVVRKLGTPAQTSDVN
jgi:hypothetical protein